MTRTCLSAIAQHVGVQLTDEQSVQFRELAHWLTTEGVAIGGIGPHEADRIWQRHLCDSVVFGLDLVDRRTLLDVGSGVGLPGIPLAILHPGLDVTLVDRAGRRVDALMRLREILGLRYDVVHASVEEVVPSFDRVTYRASLRLQEAIRQSARLIGPHGDAWFGLGRGELPDALLAWRGGTGVERHGLVIEEHRVGAEILDSPAWLLRMTRP